jgi:hypothetical protein
MALVNGEARPEWFFDPRDIIYFHGWGMPEASLRKRLGELIAFGGVGALQLADKPQLERAILDFVHDGSRVGDVPMALRGNPG